MYLSHYNLAEKPFQITADPKFLWLGEKHQEALAILKYGVLDNKGFLLLTGDVGTGKTTLINALLRDLDSNTIVATILDPNLEKLEFFSFLAKAFEIEDKFTKEADFLDHFTQFLNNAYLDNKKVLLIIDEAQKLSIELLEEIRLLSNIKKENIKLLNIFFVGQNEFRKTLKGKECSALRQRITITHQINPLTRSETKEYIKYRLKVAGTEEEIFNTKAISKVYAFSRGYPRLINIICDDALLTGYVGALKTITPSIIKKCAHELTVPDEITPNHLQWQPPTGRHKKRPLRRGALYACLLLVVAFLGYLFNPSGYSDYIHNLKIYYGRLFSSAKDLSSKHPAEKIRVQKAQQPPISQPVLQANEGKEPLISGDFKVIIPFDYNSNQLPAEAYDALDRLAAAMVQDLEMKVVVEGHTDTIGGHYYNKKLSDLRANTVKTYLVAKGISPSRIWNIGMGQEDPVEPNTTEAGRAANRRVEIELHPPGGQ